MKNILFIQMNELYVEFVLGVVIQTQDKVDFLVLLYTYKWDGFGFKTKEEAQEYNPILVAENVNEMINYFDWLGFDF